MTSSSSPSPPAASEQKKTSSSSLRLLKRLISRKRSSSFSDLKYLDLAKAPFCNDSKSSDCDEDEVFGYDNLSLRLSDSCVEQNNNIKEQICTSPEAARKSLVRWTSEQGKAGAFVAPASAVAIATD